MAGQLTFKQKGPKSAMPISIFASACEDAESYVGEAEAQSASYCYDVDKTWVENLANGLPTRCNDVPAVDRPWAPEQKWISFLNHKLASPLGVAAGPLLSAEWIGLAGSRGYDCLTYKTIRSHYHAGHGLPNILQLDVSGQLSAFGPACDEALFARPAPVAADATPATTTTTTAAASAAAGLGAGSSPLAITNSFGMPSQGPQEVVADLRRGAGMLRPCQMMVVSVTGTPGREGLSFTEDLVLATRIALEGGATTLEVNLSCPNVGSSHVALYQDAPAVEATVARLVQEVGSVPLVLKVGAFPDQDSLRRMLAAAESAGASAVSGINGLSRRVELPGGCGPALGPDRPTSGVCGDPIREAGLEFVTWARQINAADSLRMGIIGVGGVTQADHVMQYLHAGADVVQAATGFMWRPHLGTDFQRLWQAVGYCLPVADGRGGRT